MRQVRAEAASSRGSRYRVAVNTRCRFKHSLSGGRTSGFRRPLLLMHPPFELPARLHVDAQQHFGMLSTAVLRALAQEDARFVRIDPHLIWVIGNEVGFARKARHPEAVIRIGR